MIENFSESAFFTSIQGRKWIRPDTNASVWLTSPEDIVYALIRDVLGYNRIDYNSWVTAKLQAQTLTDLTGWEFDFCLTEKESAKKLIKCKVSNVTGGS